MGSITYLWPFDEWYIKKEFKTHYVIVVGEIDDYGPTDDVWLKIEKDFYKRLQENRFYSVLCPGKRFFILSDDHKYHRGYVDWDQKTIYKLERPEPVGSNVRLKCADCDKHVYFDGKKHFVWMHTKPGAYDHTPRPYVDKERENKHYHIHILIDEENRDKAMNKLKETVEEITECPSSELDLSEHDDSYMPYRFYSCFFKKNEHLRKKKNETNSPCGC